MNLRLNKQGFVCLLGKKELFAFLLTTRNSLRKKKKFFLVLTIKLPPPPNHKKRGDADCSADWLSTIKE